MGKICLQKHKFKKSFVYFQYAFMGLYTLFNRVFICLHKIGDGGRDTHLSLKKKILYVKLFIRAPCFTKLFWENRTIL